MAISYLQDRRSSFRFDNFDNHYDSEIRTYSQQLRAYYVRGFAKKRIIYLARGVNICNLCNYLLVLCGTYDKSEFELSPVWCEL